MIALSEVEVIAQVVPEREATTSFIRGDANCDTHVNLTDAIAILTARYRSGTPLCCDEASDVDANARVDLSDAIFLLKFLFREGEKPAAPFPFCERISAGELSCDQENCF